MGISDLIRRQAAAEDERRWERAWPSLERNGLVSPTEGPGYARFETGHSVIIPYSHGSGQWRMWVSHDSDPDDQRLVIANLGPGDEDVGERAASALRSPHVLRSMREQMIPGAEDDGTWPRRF
jgi:hypothetical protein